MRQQCEPFCKDYKTCKDICNDYLDKAEDYADSISFGAQMESNWKSIQDKYGIETPDELYEELKKRGELQTLDVDDFLKNSFTMEDTE